ncbi:MAG: hydrogenase expression/formation protein HypE [Planctomycetota bacterium]|nr:MAG: hydrogenase expression/formation protein HypE [Planctomycetota bacterium]
MTATHISSRVSDRVMLAHGGGGELTSELIEAHFLPRINNPALAPLADGAIVPIGSDQSVVFTTDSYVVTPLEFPGGDIGRLAVCGTVNDLAVMGAEPLGLSLGVIMEEGLSLDVLDRVVASIARAAREARVPIVTGDTKVIERRGNEGLFLNTAGIGRLRPGLRLGTERVESGDVILFSGRIADHGLTIMSVRAGIAFDSDLRSDAAPLADLISALSASGADVKFMRDPTRGGVAGVLADMCLRSGYSIEINEAAIPISPTARHAAEMLGLDPLTVANEGKLVCVVRREDAAKAIKAMQDHPLGREAAIVGRVTDAEPPLVELRTRAGGRRIVQRPYGEELPRIC